MNQVIDPDSISIPELARLRAQEQPCAPLVVTDHLVLSFADVDGQSDRVAAALAALGIVKGDRVGLYAINCPEFTVAYLGILKAGGVVVPVNVLLNPREVAFILGDSGARLLIAHPQLLQAVPAVQAALERLLPVVSLGDGGDHPWKSLLAHGGAAPAITFDAVQDLAAILYTSGTTGHPKGAMLSHRNLVTNTFSVREAVALLPGVDRILLVLPQFHAFAATVGMLTSLLHGVSFVPLPRFEPDTVAAAIEQHRATLFLGVPSMYTLLLRLGPEARARLASLRRCISGGAALPVEVMHRFEEQFGLAIHEGDGPTECGPVTCLNPVGGTRKAGSVGLPIPRVEMRIAGDDGATLADGVVGEICVRSPSVMRGYWGLPEETTASFFDDWFRTGDLGYRDADGYFFMVDRRKDLIIVNGMNVYPRIVEECLYRLPALREAAVVGEPHALHGEIPVAYVVAREPGALDAAAVRDHCKEFLGRHEIPRKVYFLDELPKTATGKILKRALRRQGEVERGVGGAALPGAGASPAP